jgi:hypothetical protein
MPLSLASSRSWDTIRKARQWRTSHLAARRPTTYRCAQAPRVSAKAAHLHAQVALRFSAAQMLQQLLGSAVADSMPTSVAVACSGVLGGGGLSLRRFLREYVELALDVGRRTAAFNRWIPDQILLNYLVWHPRPRARIFGASFDSSQRLERQLGGDGCRLVLQRNEEGPIYHAQWPLVRRHHEEPFGVCTPDRRSVAAIVQ